MSSVPERPNRDERDASDAFIASWSRPSAVTGEGRSVAGPRSLSPEQPMRTAELKRRLARWAGIGTAAEERAQVDALFGADRIDDT